MFHRFWIAPAILIMALRPALSEAPDPSPEDMLMAAAVIRYVHENCDAVGLTPMHYLAAGLAENSSPEGAAQEEFDRVSSLIARRFDDVSAACSALQQTLATPQQ